MTRHYSPRPRPRCPRCYSGWLVVRAGDRRYCKVCHVTFPLSELIQPPGAAQPKPPSGNVAPSRQVPEFKPLERDPFEHMRLCLTVKR